MPRPRLAFTMGDAAGIGPELIVCSWQHRPLHQWCQPFVVGHPEVLRRAAALANAGQRVEEIDAPEEAQPSPQVIPCLRAGSDDVLAVAPGRVDPRAGRAAYQSLALAAELALASRVNAVTTAPLNKEALNLAGLACPGHTEALADLCGVDEAAMTLYLAPGQGLQGPAGLGVVHVTLHMALAEVFQHITTEAVLGKARLLDDAMHRLKRSRPRLGLAALNPHAGEGGLFGDEERRILRPAVERAQDEGIDLVGPLPADTLFCRARAGEFDGVVAMYHDQGHIALKLMDFHRAVNITLGLPIIRTSPTYGTAFDIAWQGVAEIQGMLEAARVASVLAAARADTGGCLGSSGASPQPGEVMGSLRSTTATPPTPLAVQGQRR